MKKVYFILAVFCILIMIYTQDIFKNLSKITETDNKVVNGIVGTVLLFITFCLGYFIYRVAGDYSLIKNIKV